MSKEPCFAALEAASLVTVSVNSGIKEVKRGEPIVQDALPVTPSSSPSSRPLGVPSSSPGGQTFSPQNQREKPNQ